jgi:hypothetical protein
MPKRVIFHFDETSLITVDEMRRRGWTKFIEISVRDSKTGQERTLIIPDLNSGDRGYTEGYARQNQMAHS